MEHPSAAPRLIRNGRFEYTGAYDIKTISDAAMTKLSGCIESFDLRYHIEKFLVQTRLQFTEQIEGAIGISLSMNVCKCIRDRIYWTMSSHIGRGNLYMYAPLEGHVICANVNDHVRQALKDHPLRSVEFTEALSNEPIIQFAPSEMFIAGPNHIVGIAKGNFTQVNMIAIIHPMDQIEKMASKRAQRYLDRSQIVSKPSYQTAQCDFDRRQAMQAIDRNLSQFPSHLAKIAHDGKCSYIGEFDYDRILTAIFGQVNGVITNFPVHLHVAKFLIMVRMQMPECSHHNVRVIIIFENCNVTRAIWGTHPEKYFGYTPLGQPWRYMALNDHVRGAMTAHKSGSVELTKELSNEPIIQPGNFDIFHFDPKTHIKGMPIFTGLRISLFLNVIDKRKLNSIVKPRLPIAKKQKITSSVAGDK